MTRYKRKSKITVPHSNCSLFESCDYDDVAYFSSLASEERDEMAKLHL